MAFKIETNTYFPIEIPNATSSRDGLMSAADKAKLDSLAPGPANYDFIADLPAAGLHPGEFGFVFSLNQLFYSDGTIWFYTSLPLNAPAQLDRYVAALVEIGFGNVWPMFQACPAGSTISANFAPDNCRLSSSGAVTFDGDPIYPAAVNPTQKFVGGSPEQVVFGDSTADEPFVFTYAFRALDLPGVDEIYDSVGGGVETSVSTTGQLKLFTAGGMELIASSPGLIQVGGAYVVVVTYTPGESNQFALYVNGNLIGMATSAYSHQVFLVNAGASSNMTVAALALGNNFSLTPTQIANLYAVSQQEPF